MNNQGQFELRKMIYWTIAMIVITLVVFASAMIMASYGAKLSKVPPNLRAELISLRFVNAPECFAYRDLETGRILPGIVDLNKFNEENLMNCYLSGSRKNFNFQLVLGDKTLETDEWYSAGDFTLYKEILVKDGERIKPMLLKINVQEKV
jgi:hypothetical protein